MRLLMILILTCVFQANAQAPATILIYHRTTQWRHPSIDDALKVLTSLSREKGWQVETSDSPGFFSEKKTLKKRAVVFLSNTGDVLSLNEKESLEAFYRRGNGIMAIHAALSLRQHWPFFQSLIGKEFLNLTGPELKNVSTGSETWQSFDEWFHFVPSPLPQGTEVLSRFSPSEPLTWRRKTFGGRFWFTAMGHTPESYQNAHFRKELKEGLQWLLE